MDSTSEDKFLPGGVVPYSKCQLQLSLSIRKLSHALQYSTQYVHVSK